MKKRFLVLRILIFVFLFSLPSYSAEATETQFFYDDFESGVDNWGMESGWSVILEDNNHILQGTQHTFATAYLDGVTNNLELRLKLLKGTVHINIRTNQLREGLNRYLIGFNKEGSYAQKQIGKDFQSLGNGRGISLNEWHNIKIEIVQDEIKVFSNSDLILSLHDKDLIKEGGISFETLEGSQAYIDDVKVKASLPEARELKLEDLFPNSEHKGDLTLEGRDFLILEDGEFEQFGNVYLKDSSKLIIRDSTFRISRYQRLLNHWGVYLEDKASLEIENSKLLPSSGETLFVINARDRSSVNMKDSPTKIHLFSIFDNAKAVVENSEIVGVIGGLVSAFDKADIKIINSKIGAVNLHIPPNATLIAEGLGTGFYKNWELQKNLTVSGIDYNVILENTELVADRIGPGPFERGFPVFIDSSAKVKIKNSEVRKIVITVNNEKAEFSNFYLEKPSNFRYRDIELENVTVKGQWGIFLHGASDVVVKDSDAFWTFIYDGSKLKLVNTHMNEFDPRDFNGEMIFENSRWDTAAEIIENNDFIMKGSLIIGNIGGFSWENSGVTRIYDVIGKPNIELTLRKGEETIWQGKTDEDGMASFNIKFEDSTFNDIFELEDSLGRKIEVTFFSSTPLNLKTNIVSKFISKMKYKEPSPQMKLTTLISILVVIGIIIFLIKKKF
ncbi:MAG: hypothetical protein AB1668_03825 [Nanoarchaeota archaeon]